MGKYIARMKDKLTVHIIALAALGGGLSGGDRIFIEFARRWSKKVPVNVYVWEEGFAMCNREKLEGDNLEIKVVNVGEIAKLGFVVTYFYRVFLGIKLGLSLRPNRGDYVYSASEFWMDALAGLILKMKNSNIKWVAAWFQTAPNPLSGFSEGERRNLYRLRASLYWFIQKTTKPLISRFADLILVNNENEKKQFNKNSTLDKTMVVLGAVNLEKILKYLKGRKASGEKKYLAVFQGRFHPQKGVVEMIDIWKFVTEKKPDAKLAMIGGGPLMADVKERIKQLKLDKNIDLLGYLHDGDIKYKVFESSEVVVHPAFFDSGGMAAAEAMAFGKPCVGFDLKSYLSYYPKGMLRVPVGDLKGFAKQILLLNIDRKLYTKMAKEAGGMIWHNWSWDERAHEVFKRIQNLRQ